MPNTPTPNVGLNKPAQGDTPWDVTVNGNMDRLDAIFGGTFTAPALAVTSLQPTSITKYGGVPTVAGGVPALVAKADATAQAANVGLTLLYAVPAGGAGLYRVAFIAVLTQAATVSSTIPNAQLQWTDNDSATSVNPAIPSNSGFTVTNNTLGIGASSTSIINAKASTNINWGTVNYASSGATPMQYAIHVKLEYLGL